jgi:sigma-E factor negative regulatory protein RseC
MSDTIHQTGIIEHIDPDKVYVKVIQQSACAGCQVKSMCSSSECKARIVEIEGHFDSFHVNEQVEIEGKNSLGYLAVLYAFVSRYFINRYDCFLFKNKSERSFQCFSRHCCFARLL